LNTHYTYLLILAASFAGPFFLSFDKKVAFYKKWKYVFAAMIIPAVFYIAWDSYFTRINVWQFNSKYIVGPKFLELPVEEWLFFIIIPYCCIFVYECIKC
jgi:lycopene cyclase domain-containing protein